jgi:hypothetical protein
MSITTQHEKYLNQNTVTQEREVLRTAIAVSHKSDGSIINVEDVRKL